MSEDTCPVLWTGQLAVVTLPRDIDSSNAGQIREQLMWIINRGAAVLVADMTGTVSCDYSGADALARAQHRAVANGTELRLVVTADVVRRVLSLNGFDRLVSVYPDLTGAIAAGAERRESPGAPTTQATYGAAAWAQDLLSLMVDSIFNVGLIVQAAMDLLPDVTAQRITEALQRLDDAAREIRNHVFAEHCHSVELGPAGLPSPQLPERSARAMDHAASLQKHVAQTARAVQSAAADTAALLERRVDLVGQPGRIDYPTEIKKWRAFADQAGQMTERWEQGQMEPQGARIGVFLVDDHEVVRRGVRVLLEAEPDITVVGEAGTASSALARIPAVKPDVAVLDVRLPDGDGVSVCRELRSGMPQVACLMLTSFDDEEALFGAIIAGATGYVLKQIRGADLVAAVRAVASGQSLLDPQAVSQLMRWMREQAHRPDPLAGLTDQDKRILALIGEGLTNREIGERLYLSEKTIKNYVTELLARLSMHRRAQAAALAARVFPADRGKRPGQGA